MEIKMDCIKIQTKVLDILEDQSDTSSTELFENFKVLYGLELEEAYILVKRK